MGEKLPVRIYLREETIDALKEAAENITTDAMTYNEVASEVITRCLPIWIQARAAFDGVIDDYFRRVGRDLRDRKKSE